MYNHYSDIIMKIEVVSIVGENCITREDGENLQQQIHRGLSRGEGVEVDFTGVRIYASPFFNAAFGQLIRDFEKNTLNKKLTVVGLTGHGNHILRRVISNSERFYSDSNYKRALETVIGHISEE